MSNESLMMIIAALVGAHYVSMIYEIRKLRVDISVLKDQVNASILSAAQMALAASQAAAAASTVAAALITAKAEAVSLSSKGGS